MRVEIVPLRIPLASTQAMTVDWTLDAMYVVVARIRDDDGVEGVGYALTFNGRFHRALQVTTEALASLLDDIDMQSVEPVWTRLRADVAQSGADGIASHALGCIDIALWDLAGKRAGAPVFRLLGASRRRVEVYASATYFVGLGSEDDFLATAQQLLDRGFTAMKLGLRAEGLDWRAGVERVERIRAFVGDGVDLMLDCGQRFSVAEVIQLGRALEPCRLAWIEDPIDQSDMEGHAEIAAALDTPVATGEWAFSVDTLQRWATARAADTVIADVPRIGGFTPWMQLAHTAADCSVELAGHLQSEVSLHALAAAPAARWLEYSEWTFPMFTNPPTLVDGALELGDGPGLGLELAEDAIAQYRVDGPRQ